MPLIAPRNRQGCAPLPSPSLSLARLVGRLQFPDGGRFDHFLKANLESAVHARWGFGAGPPLLGLRLQKRNAVLNVSRGEIMNRAFGIVITLVWLAAMTALVRRDVLPYWTAQEAPRTVSREGAFQAAVRNEAGRRVGTTWVTLLPGPQLLTVRSATVLNLSALGRIIPVRGRVLIETDLTYEHDGTLIQFDFHIHGSGVPISVTGERLGRDFACTAEIGGMKSVVPLDWRMSEGLGELMRPFTQLENLHVGRRWRLRLIDPFSVLTGGGAVEFKTQLVTVTARENIVLADRRVECFRIETEGAVAWADDAGRIVRQEVNIPLLGRWLLEDEPFDRAAMKRAAGELRGVDSAGVAKPHIGDP